MSKDDVTEFRGRTITCNEAMSKLYDYLDSELDDITEEEIDRHVHDCRECFSRMDFEKRLRAKVQNLDETQTPPDVQDRLMALVKKF